MLTKSFSYWIILQMVFNLSFDLLYIHVSPDRYWLIIRVMTKCNNGKKLVIPKGENTCTQSNYGLPDLLPNKSRFSIVTSEMRPQDWPQFGYMIYDFFLLDCTFLLYISYQLFPLLHSVFRVDDVAYIGNY